MKKSQILNFTTSQLLATFVAFILSTSIFAATWNNISIDTDAAGGISATRFDHDKIAVAYASPAANKIVVAIVADYTNTISKQVIASSVSALNVELCTANTDDDDLFAVWDDGAGNLKWARKNDSPNWKVREVKSQIGASNTFSLQLHKIDYEFTNPFFPFNTYTIEITVPMVYYRNIPEQQLERVYVDGYNYGSGEFSWSREIILTTDNPGKGLDTSSFANDIYHHIVSHCQGPNNDAVLTVRLESGWTNFMIATDIPGAPFTSFEQGLDDMPRMAFQRFYSGIPIDTSGLGYFDSGEVVYNYIDSGVGSTDLGNAPALKLNHIGRPIAAYYWGVDNTVKCATRGGKVGGFAWDAEACASGVAWDGNSPSIDLAALVSNTYVFYIDSASDDLFLTVGDFVPPDEKIFGVVTNILNGDAVTNAYLTAYETVDWTYVFASSDDVGNYAFEYIPTGMYTVTCSATNYFEETTNITVTTGIPYELDFSMRPIPEPMSIVFSILFSVFGFLFFKCNRNL